MARILCAKSGVEFQTEHFTHKTSALMLTSREVDHPIFACSSQELLVDHAPAWLDGKLTDTESYLMYLAVWNSTGLVDFRSPAIRTPNTLQVIATNRERLLTAVETITDLASARTHSKLNLPRFVITPDTADLENTSYWIQNIILNWQDYLSGYKTTTAIEKLNLKESILERYIKDSTKDISTYADKLANWAMEAGAVDTNYLVTNEHNRPEQLTAYWKRLIKACVKTEAIFEIPEDDLECLIEYMEDCIPHGTIYANSLMSLLREGRERKRNFLDLGDIDIGSNGAVSFRLLDADASIEDANKLRLIDSAPMHKPVESNYPNKLAYIRAKMNYDMATEYKASNANVESSVNIEPMLSTQVPLTRLQEQLAKLKAMSIAVKQEPAL